MERSLTSPNWASLHGDLLGLILKKLDLFYDYIRFSAVCKYWNSIALFYKENHIRAIDGLLYLLRRLENRDKFIQSRVLESATSILISKYMDDCDSFKKYSFRHQN